MTFKKWWIAQDWNLGHILARLGVLDDVYIIAEKAYNEGYHRGKKQGSRMEERKQLTRLD